MPTRPEEDIRSPGARETGGFEPPGVGNGNQYGPLEEQEANYLRIFKNLLFTCLYVHKHGPECLRSSEDNL